MNATSLLLEPLRSEDGDALVQNLLGSAELAPRERERIVEAAGGNPLFVEEILSMLIDDGLLMQQGDRWVPTGDLTTRDPADDLGGTPRAPGPADAAGAHPDRSEETRRRQGVLGRGSLGARAAGARDRA